MQVRRMQQRKALLHWKTVLHTRRCGAAHQRGGQASATKQVEFVQVRVIEYACVMLVVSVNQQRMQQHKEGMALTAPELAPVQLAWGQRQKHALLLLLLLLLILMLLCITVSVPTSAATPAAPSAPTPPTKHAVAAALIHSQGSARHVLHAIAAAKRLQLT